MRVLLHVQHLTGVGHFVRADRIARALAADDGHEVLMLDGGRAVPRPPPGPASGERLRLLPLARICRGRDGALAALEGGTLAAAMGERGRQLDEAVRAFEPDVLLVEHFPFGKWELADEIDGLIRAVRAARPGVLVVTSLRDIPNERRHEGASAGEHGRRVVARLVRDFDAVLVHTDPRFIRWQDQLPSVAALDLPVHTTGIVAPGPATGACAVDERGDVVLSVGGGANADGFLASGVQAWRRLRASGGGGALGLSVHPGLPVDDGEAHQFEAGGADIGARDADTGAGTVSLHRFETGFAARLRGAELSVSRAGYNTCADVLRAGCRAVLVPDPRMADQCRRAARFAELGLAVVVEDVGGPALAESLAVAMASALGRPRPHHDFDLDGAQGTRRALERLTGQETAGSVASPGAPMHGAGRG